MNEVDAFWLQSEMLWKTLFYFSLKTVLEHMQPTTYD